MGGEYRYNCDSLSTQTIECDNGTLHAQGCYMSSLFEKLDQLQIRPVGDLNDQVMGNRQDIDRLEKLLGFPFPLIYIEYLLHYGVATIDDAMVTVPDNWDDVTDFACHDLFALFSINGKNTDSGIVAYNLEKEIKSAQFNNLPPHFLPFACSDGPSTQYFLSCQDDKLNGHVFALWREKIWDVSEGEISAAEACDQAIHLADSLEDFFDRLSIDDYENESDNDVEPVFAAFVADDKRVIQQIIDAGEIETFRSKSGLSLLHCAILSDKAWPVEMLLKQNSSTTGSLWGPLKTCDK